MECPYCYKKMQHLDGYWYCEACNAGIDDYDEEDEDPNDESYGAEDYYNSRPWGPNNDGY